jgi:hypothetical protein
VIDDQTPFVPLVVPRVSGGLTELAAKQVKIGNRRYIVCRNLAEARRAAEQRGAILDGLRAKLAQGDKALVGNSGFRRYLKTVSAKHFAIDETRVAEDARFDGLYVSGAISTLRTVWWRRTAPALRFGAGQRGAGPPCTPYFASHPVWSAASTRLAGSGRRSCGTPSRVISSKLRPSPSSLAFNPVKACHRFTATSTYSSFAVGPSAWMF